MYKKVKKAKLGRETSHRKALMLNQIRSLFANGKLVTTSPKAKVLKGNVESLVLKGKKKGSELSFRREVINVLGSDELVKKYYEYIKNENSGVTIVKIGFRSGDNGEVSRVSLLGIAKKKVKASKKVEETVVKKEEMKEEKKESNNPIKNILRRDNGKGIDKTAVVRKTERAKSRSGL